MMPIRRGCQTESACTGDSAGRFVQVCKLERPLSGISAGEPMYFDDIRVGDVPDGASHRATREAIVASARAFEPQPFHIDEGIANKSLSGGLTASGAYTAAPTAIQARMKRVQPGHDGITVH